MTSKEKDAIFAAFLDLELLVLDYRKAILWLTQGNYKATPHSSVQETRELMRDLKEKITTLLEEIEART